MFAAPFLVLLSYGLRSGIHLSHMPFVYSTLRKARMAFSDFTNTPNRINTAPLPARCSSLNLRRRSIFRMFNLGLSNMFTGASPQTLRIQSGIFNSAVAFYKSALSAEAVSARRRAFVILESRFQFRIRIEIAAGSSTTSNTIRLELPKDVNTNIIRSIANKLAAGRAEAVQTTRAGYRVTDPYNVKWTLVR